MDFSADGWTDGLFDIRLMPRTKQNGWIGLLIQFWAFMCFPGPNETPIFRYISIG